MKKKLSIILIAIGSIMILSAAMLFLYNAYENKRASESSSAVVDELEERIEGQSIDAAVPSVKINDIDYIGILYIPSQGKSFPVMADWNYDKLKLAPCKYYGDAKTKDLVIAGHNYRDMFGRLFRLKEGDEVSFLDLQGNQYTYEVGTIEILEPDDIDLMIESNWDLSLYTCTYGGRQRVTVRCRMVADLLMAN